MQESCKISKRESRGLEFGWIDAPMRLEGHILFKAADRAIFLYLCHSKEYAADENVVLNTVRRYVPH